MLWQKTVYTSQNLHYCTWLLLNMPKWGRPRARPSTHIRTVSNLSNIARKSPSLGPSCVLPNTADSDIPPPTAMDPTAPMAISSLSTLLPLQITSHTSEIVERMNLIQLVNQIKVAQCDGFWVILLSKYIMLIGVIYLSLSGGNFALKWLALGIFETEIC